MKYALILYMIPNYSPTRQQNLSVPLHSIFQDTYFCVQNSSRTGPFQHSSLKFYIRTFLKQFLTPHKNVYLCGSFSTCIFIQSNINFTEIELKQIHFIKFDILGLY